MKNADSCKETVISMPNAKRDWFVVMTIVVVDSMNHTIVVITVSNN